MARQHERWRFLPGVRLSHPVANPVPACFLEVQWVFRRLGHGASAVAGRKASANISMNREI